LIKEVCKNSEIPRRIMHDGTPVVYNVTLPPALVTTDAQHEFAQKQAIQFVNVYLTRLLKDSSMQLKKPEYHDHEKFLYIGLQPDARGLIPWNETILTEIKAIFNPIASAQGVKAICSEDVNFSVRSYA